MQNGESNKPRRVDPLLVEVEGHAETLIGNEAIVRGALEAGVAFASGYPGTPSSEVTDSFARIAEQSGIVFEYSINEKIALEMAFAASLAGARSICAMKHLGLMYAGDPISTIPYIGVNAGMVVVSAGDPSCRTSPNEQDQRHLATMLNIPMLDPPTPQQAHTMTRFAFELSERSKLPVILRPTTRVCHTRAVIRYGQLKKPNITGFVRDPRRLVPIPVNARRLRRELIDRVEVARDLLEQSDFIFQSRGSGKVGICASGAPAATCADLLRELGLEDQVSLLSLGVVYPLPTKQLLEFLGRMDRVLVVEELSPYLESALLALSAEHRLETEILGKRTGHLPLPYEYEPEVIQEGIYRGLGLGTSPGPGTAPPEVPPRPPILCPGCSHRSTYFAAKMVFGEGATLYFNDIGCYTLGYGPPLNTADALLCMGAAFTLAAGVSRTTGQRTVAFMGDSTFFHSGITPLINAVKEEVSMVAVILDNQVTAMTGFQESPFIELTPEGEPARRIDIEAVVRGLGVPHVEKVDTYDLPASIAALERAREARGVSVVIAEHPCSNFLARHAKAAATPEKYPARFVVDHDLCGTCGRESCGARCKVEVTRGYEHHLARNRSLEVERTEPLPTVAPCASSCPLFHCIQGYVGHIAAGEHAQALEHILSHNPLPETVCRVCHRPCETACLRGALDEPVAINDLKRFVISWAQQEGRFTTPPRPDNKNGERVAVVGAGPSGLAAAHDLLLRGYQVTLLDANNEPGGLLLTGIPPFRLPREALKRDVDRILGMGVEFSGNTLLGRDLQLQDLLDRGYEAIYLAVGAHRGLELGLDGEHGPGAPQVVDALAYLKSSGFSTDGGQAGAWTGKRVVVVGGGNAAIDAARTARRQGAERVTVAYRRRREEMPAIAEEVDAAADEGVELLTQLQPLSIFRGARPGLECVRTEPGEPDASGRRRPVPVGGSETLLEADQIIVAIGQAPDLPRSLGEGELELRRHNNGTLEVEPQTGQTSHPKVFAGGDAAPGERTVTWAMACGQRAAWAIDRVLRGEERANERPPPPLPREPAPPAGPGFRRLFHLPVGRPHPAELPASERRSSFAEVVEPLTEEQARAEAARCLACGVCGNCRACIDLFGCPAFFIDADGRPQIDAKICTGCGVCAAFCPNGAIVERQE